MCGGAARMSSWLVGGLALVVCFLAARAVDIHDQVGRAMRESEKDR
jgi:hypothetical protein